MKFRENERQKAIVRRILQVLLPKLCCYCCFFQKTMTNLINYIFWMTIMSSFRLKTYFSGSFQLSVSILTNILVIFLQQLLTISMIPSPVKHKQTETTQQQIQNHLKKADVSRFPVVSNEAIQELNSFAVNKHGQSTPRYTKQWMNQRLTKLVPVPPSWKYLETNCDARTWQGPEYWVLRRGHKKKRRW